MFVSPQLYEYMMMNPELIFKGQVWRLFTWIFTVPEGFGIFTIFMFLFYYWVGMSLERALGTFKYNVFIFSGWIFMATGALLIYFITNFVGPAAGYGGISIPISTYYVNLSSFLIFALLYGEHVVYLYMIIPIKVKWLAYLDIALVIYEMYSIGRAADKVADMFGTDVAVLDEYVLCYRITIVISLLNAIWFFIMFRRAKKLSKKAMQTRVVFKTETKKIKPISAVHRCSVCGISSVDDEDMTFRYCSKCDGAHEYCEEHLFTHEHIKNTN